MSQARSMNKRKQDDQRPRPQCPSPKRYRPDSSFIADNESQTATSRVPEQLDLLKAEIGLLRRQQDLDRTTFKASLLDQAKQIEKLQRALTNRDVPGAIESLIEDGVDHDGSQGVNDIYEATPQPQSNVERHARTDSIHRASPSESVSTPTRRGLTPISNVPQPENEEPAKTGSQHGIGLNPLLRELVDEVRNFRECFNTANRIVYTED